MITNYEGEAVKRWMEEAQEYRFRDPNHVIECARNLLAYAEKRDEVALQGYADFLLGDAYYTLTDGDNCLIYLNRAIQELHGAKDWEKLGECYNLLGMLFTHQGNTSSAIDYYYEGMNLVEQHQLYYIGAMISENYSELCDRLNMEEEALNRALLSLQYLEKVPDHSRYEEIRVVVLQRLLKSYLKLGRRLEARRYLEEIRQLIRNMPTDQERFDELLICVLWARSEHQTEKEEYYLNRTMKAFMDCTYRVDYFWDCIEFMNYLLETKRFGYLEKVIGQMEISLESNTFPDLQVRLSRIKIRMLQVLKREEGLHEELLKHMHYVDQLNVQNSHTMSLFITLRNSLDDTKKNNLLLKERANTDELTNLANRRYLNEMADRWFELSYQKEVRLGVEMLDIDKFKNINDTYGHRIGDDCLVVVAEAIRSFEGKNLFCARYGGDEFFILYFDYTKEEIQEVCQKIREKVTELSRVRHLPNITISQGAYTHVPTESNKVWDFTSMADRALYSVKKKGGKDYMVLKSKNELKILA